MIIVFAITLFCSASLIFVIQPMVGKMLLPLFGGTPAVWNTCMVFFQFALLAGYAYAHASATLLGARRQAVLHLAVLALPLATLPFDFGNPQRTELTNAPVAWLLQELTVTVGLAFLVLSSTAPLLQKWLTETRHRSAHDPYYLYAASNLGSFAALLGYPLVVEPLLPLDRQSTWWTAGYGLCAGCIVVCAVFSWFLPRRGIDAAIAPSDRPTFSHDAPRITHLDRVRWIVLALVPSSLMLGVTTHITTDIAAVPLLWILPLALYLLTFVLTFMSKPILSLGVASWMMPYVMLPLSVLTFTSFLKWNAVLVGLHLAGFFIAAMVCHGQLAARRPDTRYLTQFYLLVSVGGVLGGTLNALIAPVAFDRVIEYPAMLVLACFLRRRGNLAAEKPGARRWDFLGPAILALVAGGIASGVVTAGLEHRTLVAALIFGLPAVVCFSFKERPLRFGLGYAVLMVLLAVVAGGRPGDQIYLARNFFGIKRVTVDREAGVHAFFHGTTLHGNQNTQPDRRREPLLYFHRAGPLGDVFDIYSRRQKAKRVAIAGLGVGTMATYAQAGDEFTFYEIDPGVVEVASNPTYFTYLRDCLGRTNILVGDARLRLNEAGDGEFDLIILDAFSSDAVPTHLLTTEAVALYARKLATDGMIVFNVSNRFLDLVPIVGNVAHATGLACISRSDLRISHEHFLSGKSASIYCVVARDMKSLEPLLERGHWNRVDGRADMPTWTDQYCAVVPLLIRGPS